MPTIEEKSFELQNLVDYDGFDGLAEKWLGLEQELASSRKLHAYRIKKWRKIWEALHPGALDDHDDVQAMNAIVYDEIEHACRRYNELTAELTAKLGALKEKIHKHRFEDCESCEDHYQADNDSLKEELATNNRVISVQAETLGDLREELAAARVTADYITDIAEKCFDFGMEYDDKLALRDQIIEEIFSLREDGNEWANELNAIEEQKKEALAIIDKRGVKCPPDCDKCHKCSINTVTIMLVRGVLDPNTEKNTDPKNMDTPQSAVSLGIVSISACTRCGKMECAGNCEEVEPEPEKEKGGET